MKPTIPTSHQNPAWKWFRNEALGIFVHIKHARTCFMGSPLTLSSTTSLMGGSPSGFWIQAGMNWISSRNSLSYCFFPSGSRGFHCSIGREVPDSHRKQTLGSPRRGSGKSKGNRLLHQSGKFQFNLIFILKGD